MSYRGDITLEDTIDFQFNTFRFSTGAPFTLAGTPSLAAYVGNSVTQITAGLTLTVDFDGVTGYHNVRVAATAANGYAAGTNVTIVLAAGTVDGVSVAGSIVGSFSIENRAVLRPAVKDRKLDVTTIGGVTLAAVTHTGAVIPTVTTLTNLPAITANWLTAAGIAAGALNGKGDWNIGKTGYALSVAGVQAIWDILTSALTTVGSIGKLLVDNIDAAISSRSTFAGGAVASVTADVGITQAAADKVFGASGAALPELTQGVPAATPTPRAALMALYMALRNRLDVTATTKSVTNDAGTVIFKKALSDDGTTYSEAEAVSGP